MKYIITILLTVVGQYAYGQSQFDFPFLNPNLPPEDRIDNLIELLTPDEKIGMMMHASEAVPRLGFLHNWWNEAPLLLRAGLATVSQAGGMAATWNVKEHLKTLT